MNCVYCKIEINPLRIKALPNAKTCVDCSTTGAKRGVSTVNGSKDDTWNDIAIMEPEEFNRYQISKKLYEKSLKTPLLDNPPQEEDNTEE
jgi:hypothetical protein